MIAYNNTWLHNLLVHEAAEEALDNNCISEAEYKNVQAALPANFYRPNLFLRIGMFLLTSVCASFLFQLFSMMLFNTVENRYYVFLIAQGLLCYAALEFFIMKKNHYQSGVDDALTWASLIMLITGLNMAFKTGAQGASLVAFVLTLYYTLRFTDRLITLACCFSLVLLVFFYCNHSTAFIKSILPFIIMFISAIFYFAIKKFENNDRFRLYTGCLMIAEIFFLSFFYIAGNYFVVRELSNQIFDLHLKAGESIPFGFLFKFLTLAVPAFYLLTGIKRKDVIMLRTGMFAVAASVLTFKYYNEYISAEALMTIAGILLIAAAWFFIKFLKEPKKGFGSLQDSKRKNPLIAQAESLVIAETFKGTGTSPQQNTEFGGGSFGGGGAGEKF